MPGTCATVTEGQRSCTYQVTGVVHRIIAMGGRGVGGRVDVCSVCLVEGDSSRSPSPEDVFRPVEHVLVAEDVDGDVSRRGNPVGEMALPNGQVLSQRLALSRHVPVCFCAFLALETNDRKWVSCDESCPHFCVFYYTEAPSTTN